MTDFLSKLPSWPEMDFAEYGEVEIIKRARMQKLVGGFLGRNWITIPHVTHNDEVDVTVSEEKRNLWNSNNPDKKITPLVVAIKALALTLQRYPQFNVSLDTSGDNLIHKKYYHIGVAVEIPNGLLVPVIRDCDKKHLSEIAAELSTLSNKARTQGLSINEMSGGSMSISSLGHIGGTSFTPIVNAPEVAIIGMTKLQLRPMPGEQGEVVWRKNLPLSLSYDHRIINGADAARFMVAFGEFINTLEFS